MQKNLMALLTVSLLVTGSAWAMETTRKIALQDTNIHLTVDNVKDLWEKESKDDIAARLLVGREAVMRTRIAEHSTKLKTLRAQNEEYKARMVRQAIELVVLKAQNEECKARTAEQSTELAVLKAQNEEYKIRIASAAEQVTMLEVLQEMQIAMQK